MGILTVTDNVIVANCVIEGIGDCFARPIARRNSADYDKITFEWAKNNDTAALDKMLLIKPLDAVDALYLETKELARLRQQMFNLWYVWNEGLMSKTNKYISNDFISLAREAVDNSDSTKEHWHRWVLEHAAIQDLDPRRAYQDLKLIADCEPEIRFRINSLAIKWSKKINAISLQEFNDTSFRTRFIADMYTDYYGNKEI